MDQTYINLAYERALVAHLARLLKDRYLSSGGAVPSAVLHCDDLPFSIREVPQSSILSFLRRLVEEERVITNSLAEYTHVRQSPAPLSRAPEEQAHEEKKDEERAPVRKRARRARTQAGGGE